MTADVIALDRDLVIAECKHAEQQRAAECADHGARRHEGEEHQHAAIALEACGLEELDPGEPGADAERSSAQRAQKQP